MPRPCHPPTCASTCSWMTAPEDNRRPRPRSHLEHYLTAMRVSLGQPVESSCDINQHQSSRSRMKHVACAMSSAENHCNIWVGIINEGNNHQHQPPAPSTQPTNCCPVSVHQRAVDDRGLLRELSALGIPALGIFVDERAVAAWRS